MQKIELLADLGKFSSLSLAMEMAEEEEEDEAMEEETPSEEEKEARRLGRHQRMD